MLNTKSKKKQEHPRRRINEDCLGCYMLEESASKEEISNMELQAGEPCYVYQLGVEDNCPCTKCLVKAMCTESCDVVTNYIKDSSK